MVNRLNKSKQEQTSMNDVEGITQMNETGENHPVKVETFLCSMDKVD